MASRMNVPRLALVATLATVLAGCYAYVGDPYPAHYGGGYAYQGAYRQAPSGHAYDKGHAYDNDSHHEPGRHDRNAQAPRRDGGGSADRKAKPQRAPAEGYGRRDQWLPSPTARAERGAR